MDKTITLNGKEYNLGFDFSTLLCFEELSNLTWQDMFNSDSLRTRLQVVYASLKSFNDNVPAFNAFVKMLSFQDMKNAYIVVNEQMLEFASVPQIMKDGDGSGDDSPKNE